MGDNQKMDFDGIFEYFGPIGIYQILLFFILAITAFTCSEVIFNNFIGYIPDHWCRVKKLEDLPHDVQKNVASPMKTDSLGNTIFDSCRFYELNYSAYTEEEFLHWNRSSHNYNDTNIINCQDGWVYDQSVVVSSFVSKLNLVCNDEWKVQLVSTIYVGGFMAGSLVVGPIADRFGRKVGMAIFSFLKIGPAFLSAFSPVYTVLALANFLLAVGSIANYVLCFTTIIEMVGPAYRLLAAMSLSTLCSFGFMCTAIFGYFVRDSVKLQLLRAGIPCMLIISWWFIPESPRWLLLNKEGKKAEKIIRQMADVNGKELPKDFDINSVSVENHQHRKSNILDVFRSRIMTKRALILCLHWFTDSLIFYALSLNTASLSGDVYLNTFLLGAVEIPANLLAIFLMSRRRIGRRGTAFFSLALAGVACLICVPLIITQVAPDAVTVFSLLGKAGSTIGFNSMYLYSSELFPTDVRDVGLGMCSFAARVSGMAAPFVGGPLGDVWAPLPNVIFGSLSLVTAFLSLFLPETLGTPLPDNIQMAEEQERQKKQGLIAPQMESVVEVKGKENMACNEDLSIHL